MIIGTAGHIDHGKSALVEALTGQRMDRLREERARGITIDLNFAPLRLADGEVAGVVDVPGHEDFVRTMVAGAAGMDLVLLVIAADEGIMPQTREHLAIVEALGVPRGIPVLAKSDLADAEWLALVEDEVRALLAGSSVAFEPALAVSARTGAGLEELRAALVRERGRVRPRDASAPFRMPIDRAFSVAGAGTVVTGSVWSGSAAVGDHLRLLPSNLSARVRTIENHGEPCQRALPGNRAALGLASVERDAIRRGDVLVDAGLPWEPSSVLDVQLHLHKDASRPLTSRTRVHLHLGTSEVVARVLPRAPIPPGASGLARLRCETAVVARGGDRFVLRSYSPVSTIGGGVVLDPQPPSRRVQWPEGLASAVSTERLMALLQRHPPGVTSASLSLRSGLPVATITSLLGRDSRARELETGWALTELLTEAEGRGLEVLTRYHADHPSLPGMPAETLRRAIHRAPSVAKAALAALAASGAVLSDGGTIRLSGFEARIAGGQGAVESVLAEVREAGLTAPTVGDLQLKLGAVDVAGALRLGAAEGRVEAVTLDWYLAGEALEEFRAVLASAGSDGAITVSAMRERTGLSRKYLIPLLEWADRRGITRRVGEARRLT
ncbi:MAG TPA: selenocysteine-specific translation elongation factor [Gemmatimonadales bacterium]|nr:selenocysteine-specific translation elongation factor [Gemmatimonadales bacterium]